MTKSLAFILMIFVASLVLMLSGFSARGETTDSLDLFKTGGFQFHFQNVWEKNERSVLIKQIEGLPPEFEIVRLNKDALAAILETAPLESATALRDSSTVLSLPMPDGTFADFRIQEAPVLMPEMAARFPEIKSYRILGITYGTMTGRFDLTPQGFHATILHNGEIINILPADKSDEKLYASYSGNQIDADEIKEFCGVTTKKLKNQKPVEDDKLMPNLASGSTLRAYRIAIAATWEYTDKLGGGTVAGTVASINTFVNAANVFFERDMSVRLLLVNNTNIIYSTDRGFNANSDPFNNESDSLLQEVSVVLRDQVGVDNYNLGHVLGDGSNQYGGVANLGVVCSNRTFTNGGPVKGGAFSRLVAPAGNATSTSIFVHEMAHQFGALHTHNAGGCAGITPENGYEVGGGLSIMAYTGNCGVNALGPPFGGDFFHSRSIAQMTDYIVNGTGSACPVLVNTNNNAPTITIPAALNIPKNTPFILTATANDPDPGDNNNLTYTFEQYQAGGVNFPNPAFSDAGDPANTTRPIFRPFAPSTNSSRMFPSLTYILNNANTPPEVQLIPNPPFPTLQRRTGESLPQVSRTLPFRVTVRDNLGGVNDATTVLTVDGNSGPFRVTAPNTAITWAGGTTQTVTWDVANTNNAPVNAANVKISLSTDGGNTFPIVLAANVPNNGTSNVALPNGLATTTARIKIEAVGNIFFDVSDANFTISLGGTCPFINDINPKLTSIGENVIITGANFTGVTAVKFSNDINAMFTVNSDTQITTIVPNGGVGGSVALTKPGCGISQTPAVTICTGMPVTVSIDNGNVNFQQGFGTGTVFIVNRLTPATYPATLNAVTVRFPDTTSFPPTMINIVSGANANGGANINNTALRLDPVTIPANRGVAATFRVAPITITSGDFVIGYSYTAPANSRYFGANVDDSPPQNRSYSSRDGVDFVQNNAQGNYMIRAEIFTSCTSATVTNCAYNITPTTQNITGAGGNGTVNITTTQANCPWTATRNANWINFTSATTGNGNGAVNFTVAANDSPAPRTGTITIAGKTLTITQAGGTAPACNYVLNPTAVNLAATASADNTFAVAVANGCAWTATTADNWINITNGATGNGSGTVTYSLAANPNAAVRTGRITVAGQTFTITQAGTAPVCNYVLNPTNINLTAAASAGNTFAVAVANGCAWTAATADNWITITNGATGNGNGTVAFSIAENTSTTTPRVGTIAIGGQTFRVTQAAAVVGNCNYTLNPTSAVLNSGASAGNTFAVATGAGCAWTATANDNWINITGGANGTGNGTVIYSLLANSSQTNARIGTITVAGQTFTVRQAAVNQPCLPVTGGLLNWYRGEQNIFDSIGANDGAVTTGNITYAANGNFGQAFAFNGATSVAIQRQISDNFSIEFMLRTDSAGGASETDWKQGAGLVAGDDFGVSLGNGKILFGVGDITIASDQTVNDGFMYHVVATRNRASGVMRLFVDGNVSMNNGAGGTQSLDGAAQLILGKRGQNGAFYTGNLDEVKIFNADLEDNQVQAELAGCNAGAARMTIGNPNIVEGNPNPNGEFQSVAFTVNLSAPFAYDTAVEYSTNDLTAVEGVDYVGTFGTLLIPAGQKSATILVPIISDKSDEPNKQFALDLFNPSNATIEDNEGIATIIDDDSPCEFSLNANGASVSAAGGNGLTFGLSGVGGCSVNASTDVDWITIINGAMSTNGGTVTYSVAQNTGMPRSGTIYIGGKNFQVNQTGVTTAAAVSVTGRVTRNNGAGISNALISITDANGNRRTSRTNPFGYYRFTGIVAGQTYIVAVTAKRFQFAAQAVNLYEEVTNLNFVADE